MSDNITSKGHDLYKVLKQALEETKSGQHLFFDNKHALGRYAAAIKQLVDEGFAETQFIDMPEEQYSKLIVRRKR